MFTFLMNISGKSKPWKTRGSESYLTATEKNILRKIFLAGALSPLYTTALYSSDRDAGGMAWESGEKQLI